MVALTMPFACGSAFTVVPSGANDGGMDGPTNDDALVPVEGATDGGRDSTMPDEGPAEGAAPGEGGIESTVPETVVYVSNTTGADINDGTDPTQPKKTIAAGLSRAQSIGAAASVEVCKGSYIETALTLIPSSMRPTRH
jgi:hypothetical protein